MRRMKMKRSEIISDFNLTCALGSVMVGLGPSHRFHGIDEDVRPRGKSRRFCYAKYKDDMI